MKSESEANERGSTEKRSICNATSEREIARESNEAQENDTSSVCEEIIPSRIGFSDHMATEHTDNGSGYRVTKDQNCKTCHPVFNSEESLRKHMTKKHIAIGIFACDKCDKIKSKASAVKDQASASEQNKSVDESVFRSLPTSVSDRVRSDLVKQIAEGFTKNNECLSHMESVTEYSKSEAKECQEFLRDEKSISH